MLITDEPRTRRYAIVALWVFLGICCIPIDIPISRLMLGGFLPGELRALLHRAEVFGHGYGVLAIVITIYLLDPGRRGKLIHLSACFLAGGLAADLIKSQVWRVRPRAYVESGMTGSTFLGSIWTTDQIGVSTIMDHSHHSFPSAHTAGAVGLAYALGRLYPRGRAWFIVLAALCAMSRVDGGAHFASDVCWGVALGYLLSASLPAADRMEAWADGWRRQKTPVAEPARRFSKAA